MKVIELINKLNEIGYDENTELTFSCVDGNTGEWYKLNADDEEYEMGITYGKDLTGEEYHNDVIDVCLNVDECKEYVNDKVEVTKLDVIEDIFHVINKYL